jgi:hypothetical protein
MVSEDASSSAMRLGCFFIILIKEFDSLRQFFEREKGIPCRLSKGMDGNSIDTREAGMDAKMAYRSAGQKYTLALTGMILFCLIAVGYTYAIPYWVVGILCLIVLIQCVFVCWWWPRRQEEQRQAELRGQREEALRLLSQYRHDWLNHIQLVQGYLQMKKYERAAEPIRACVEEARKHAKLGSLASPLVAYRIMDVTLRYPLLQIDVQAPGLTGGELPFAVEAELAETLYLICAEGGEWTNRTGRPVHWGFTILQRGTNGFAIGLHVSGESISDESIDNIIRFITDLGWVFEASDRVADGYHLTFHLSYSPKGLRLPKQRRRSAAGRELPS